MSHTFSARLTRRLVVDNTRIHWGDSIAISHLNNRQHVVHSESVLWRSGSHEQMVAAKPEVVADTNKFWIIKTGNGQADQVSGQKQIHTELNLTMFVSVQESLCFVAAGSD